MRPIRRRKSQADKNQPEIVVALRAAGAKVWVIRQPFDLLVAFRGQFHVLEVKMPGKELSSTQKEIAKEMELAGCRPRVVHSSEDALQAIGAIWRDGDDFSFQEGGIDD